ERRRLPVQELSYSDEGRAQGGGQVAEEPYRADRGRAARAEDIAAHCRDAKIRQVGEHAGLVGALSRATAGRREDRKAEIVETEPVERGGHEQRDEERPSSRIARTRYRPRRLCRIELAALHEEEQRRRDGERQYREEDDGAHRHPQPEKEQRQERRQHSPADVERVQEPEGEAALLGARHVDEQRPPRRSAKVSRPPAEDEEGGAGPEAVHEARERHERNERVA